MYRIGLDEGALSKKLGPILKKGIRKFLSEKALGEKTQPSKKEETDLLRGLFKK